MSSDIERLLKYFNETAVIAYFRIFLALIELGWASVFSYNLSLYMKYLKSSVFAILLSKSVATALE